jgi:signal transduction histidine kinase
MAGQIEATEVTRRRLLADLAHELRTPVATLHAYLEGVEDGVVALDPPTVSTMRAQTARLARLTEDIRAVSRAEEHRMDLHWRLVPVGALVSSSIQSAGRRFEAKGVRLIQHVDGGLPALAADPDLLTQALGHLLDNALRHTPPGGTVSLHARLAARDRPAVELVLNDDGDGIAAEHLPHVFERFYRVDTARDRDHGGSGIGLAIVKALVESHGGTVAVRSAGIGRGATFTARLPAPSARSLASSGVVGRDGVGLVGQP